MTQQTSTPRLSVPVSEQDHSQGSTDALAELVEYGDYECPACGEAFSVVRALQKKLSGRLRFVFRNFPLAHAHPNARGAALAAEAAGLQGKFWEMNDLLFESQETLQPSDLVQYAKSLGLDLKRFEADCQGDPCEQRVQQDILSGARSGVNGTPTFFINGVRYDREPDVHSMEEALLKVMG
jgi:protein-disulfide isomerase